MVLRHLKWEDPGWLRQVAGKLSPRPQPSPPGCSGPGHALDSSTGAWDPFLDLLSTRETGATRGHGPAALFAEGRGVGRRGLWPTGCARCPLAEPDQAAASGAHPDPASGPWAFWLPRQWGLGPLLKPSVMGAQQGGLTALSPGAFLT